MKILCPGAYKVHEIRRAVHGAGAGCFSAACFAVFACVWLLSVPAQAGPALSTEPDFPQVNKPTKVVLSGAGTETYRLEVTYRPNSQTAETVPVGAFPNNGIIVWTPKDEGITKLSAIPDRKDAKEVSRIVATRFDGIPLSGLFVFLIAAGILFGGMGFSIRSILRADDPVEPGSH